MEARRLTKAELAEWLDRKPPPRTLTGLAGADDTEFRYVSWRDDFEPATCRVERVEGGWVAVNIATEDA